MKTINKSLVFTILFIGLLLGFIGLHYTSSEPEIPDLVFEDIDGHSHTLSQYNNKPILVIFWATDCPGCIEEMPELNALHRDYGSDLAMIGVAMAHDTPAHIKAMRQQRQIPYLLTWDKDNEIATAFNRVRVTPTHFLISPKGKIVMRKIGEMDFHNLRKKLDRMGLKPV